MTLQTLLYVFIPINRYGGEDGMVSKRELLALTREIEELRRIRNALVSSAAYHDKEWLSQQRKLKAQGTPQDELDRVNETWELQHKKALLLKAKLAEYNGMQIALVDEELSTHRITKMGKTPKLQRPKVDSGPHRHRDRDSDEPAPFVAVRETPQEQAYRELMEKRERKRGRRPFKQDY
jgi:hypothetical protein